MNAQTRSLAIIAAGIGAVVALSVVVVLVAGGSANQQFEPGSPQAAMHDYLEAWEASDYELAFASFSAEVRDTTTVERYRRMAVEYYGYPGDGPRRAVYVDRVVGDGDRVRVELTVEEFYGDGLGGGSYGSQRSVPMVREGGTWKIDEPLIGLDPVPFGEFDRF